MLAITDHDTTAGWDAAAAALPAGLRLLRGAEFSCVSPTGRGDRDVSVHLLGYLFDPEHEAIVAEQTRLRTERRHRLHRIAEKMAADGYPVDPDGLLALLPDGTSAGRPHLARALVTAGVVDSVDEAFATLLHNGSPYYVPKADTPVETAIRMLRAAGGVPVFAHPFARRRGRVVEPSVIVDLAGRRARRRRGGPPRPQPGGPRPAARSGRRPRPADHRLQRLPRHQQDHPARRRAHHRRHPRPCWHKPPAPPCSRLTPAPPAHTVDPRACARAGEGG